MQSLNMVGHLIRKLHQRSTQIFVAQVREAGFDITPVQFAAMDALRENPGIDQAGVAALITYDRATIGGVIDRLRSKGLVEKSVSEKDRRAHEVRLTDHGEAVLNALLPLAKAAQDQILGQLSRSEITRFMMLAGKCLPDEHA